jgi:uncharacterized membrane protein YccC|tara:strand:- start:815 stop:1009 length:195 start_codon:yes stop_codon:yes gene_type:complete
MSRRSRAILAVARPATPTMTVSAVAALCLSIALRDTLTFHFSLFVFVVSGLVLFVLSHYEVSSR